MKGRVIFLSEEESMDATIRSLLAQAFPRMLEKEHWVSVKHQGKSNLEQSFPRKLRAWCEPGAQFLILRDNDGGNCVALKERLLSMVPPMEAPVSIRIVCQELESWFLGDLEAVSRAYPTVTRHRSFQSLGKRDPDSLTNAAQLLTELTGTQAKVERAKNIACHLQPSRNRSRSFQVFYQRLASWLTC